MGPVDDFIVDWRVGEACAQQLERIDRRVVLFRMRIATEDVVARGGVEIDFYIVLVGVKGLRLSVAKVVLQAAPGRF